MKLNQTTTMRAVICTFLVLSVVGISGCTDRQDEASYVEQLEKALTIRNEVIKQIDANSLSDDHQLLEAQKSMSEAVDVLDSEAPPKDYESAHDLEVDTLDSLAVLAGKLGRCITLEKDRPQDAKACKQAIGQDVFDDIRNNFREADAIYRKNGLSLPQLDEDNDSQRSSGSGSDVLDKQ